MALEIWTPQGKSESFEVNVDDKGKTLRAWPYKWFSIDVINNDEDNLVKVTINDGSIATARIIKATETRRFDYKKPMIERVFLITESGKTASVRVEAER